MPVAIWTRVVVIGCITTILMAGLAGITHPANASNPTFAATINLSNDKGNSTFPQMAVSGNNVYVIWQDDTPGRPNTFLRTSNNNGTTFGSVLDLTTGSGWSLNPKIAASSNYVYSVWQDNSTGNFDIILRVSNNYGSTFGPAINLDNDRFDSTIPEVAASGSSVYVVWETATAKNPQVLFTGSNNNGATFGSVTNLSNDAGSALDPMIAASANNVYVAWRDNTPGNDDVFFTASNNRGASFSPALNLSNNPGTSFDASIVAVSSNVYLAWPDNVNNPAKFQILFRASPDNGTTFLPSLSQPAMNLSNDTGIAIEPQIAGVGSSVYLTWRDSTPGNSQIFLRAGTITGGSSAGLSFSSTVNLSSDAGTAYAARIVALGVSLFATWADTTTLTGIEDVFLRGSTNNAASFGSVMNLSNNTGFSINPQISASGVNLYVTWQDNTPGTYQTFFIAGKLPPIAYPQTASTVENRSLNVTLTGSDSTGLPLSFSVASAPAHGALGSITSTGPYTAQIAYAPSLNYVGQDSFGFMVTDGRGSSSPALVSITVTGTGTSGTGSTGSSCTGRQLGPPVLC